MLFYLKFLEKVAKNFSGEAKYTFNFFKKNFFFNLYA